MPMNNTSVESYLQDGCGRCAHYQTPACKVHRWHDVLVALRALLVDTELVEEMKWGQPCYTIDGKNVVMIAAFLDRCSLGFFQGAALDDPDGVLAFDGPNSRIAKSMSFPDVAAVRAGAARVRGLVAPATELVRAGAKVKPAPAADPVPDELARRLAADPALQRAFAALTPGRRRSHLLHVGGAKQAATRERRVERCVADILAGRGFQER